MDTIRCVATTHAGDTAYERFANLPRLPAPYGCKAWLSPIKSRNLICCNLHLRVHDITGVLNTTQSAIHQMRNVVDDWLGRVGLSVNDFLLSRIDYDFNFYMEANESEILIQTLRQLPYHAMRMDKTDYPKSIYFLCKSRHAQLYRKDVEREDKGFLVAPEQKGLVRQEVQCHPSHVRYQQRRNGIPRTWDRWVTLERERFYLTHAKPIFPKGDFYTLARAAAIIQASQDLTQLNKRKLNDSLKLVQTEGMDALKAAHSTNTVKKYLGQLEVLNINPFTIKNNTLGVDFIANPFYGVHAKEGGTV